MLKELFYFTENQIIAYTTKFTCFVLGKSAEDVKYCKKSTLKLKKIIYYCIKDIDPVNPLYDLKFYKLKQLQK